MIKKKKSFEIFEKNKLFLEHKAGIFIKSESISFFDTHYLLKYTSVLITICILILVGYYLYLFINNSNFIIIKDKLKEEINSFSSQESYYKESEEIHTITQEKTKSRINNVNLKGRSKKLPKTVKYSDLFIEGSESEIQSKN